MPEDPQNKIVVDEDWKAQVEAERQQPEQPSHAADPAEPPLPAPTLLFLATSIYYQALAALGLLPHPLTGKPEVNLRLARHTIDTLDLLWDKTQGNRTAEESAGMEAMLHEIRMAYVAVESGAGFVDTAEEDPRAGGESTGPSPIIVP